MLFVKYIIFLHCYEKTSLSNFAVCFPCIKWRRLDIMMPSNATYDIIFGGEDGKQ